jgi:hypothetical protein
LLFESLYAGQVLPPGVEREKAKKPRSMPGPEFAEKKTMISSGWRFGGASDHVATKEYQVLILTPEGHILDQHTLTCADDDEAKETARVLADSSHVEVWKSPVRIVRFEPMQ